MRPGTKARFPQEICPDFLAAVHFSPIITDDTEKDAYSILLNARSPVAYHSCHLHCLVNCCDGQPRRRICVLGFTSGHVEKMRVEQARLVDEAPELDTAGNFLLACWVLMCLTIEPVGWDFAVHIATGPEQLPERFVGCRRWEATRVANDGNLRVLEAAGRGRRGDIAFGPGRRHILDGYLHTRIL